MNYDVIDEVIEDRRSFPIDRVVLYEEVRRQYENLEISENTRKAIVALKDSNTFTVITAHQPSLLTGPLYFIVKIASAIHLSNKISKEKNIHVVPVFITGGEDHDFEEINHFEFFGKKIVWERDYGGPVGRMSLDGIQDIISQTSEILGNSELAIDLKQKLENSIQNASNYGEFMIRFTQSLFDSYGLLVVNFDNRAFKNQFKPLIKKEITTQFSQNLVLEQQKKLENVGFESQAHARKINFFYLTESKRSRIIKEGNYYKILDSEIKFSQEELLDELENHPERFSPNVIMRPLYQEMIMPNLAYIGGGGELAYWMERKTQFEEAGIFFPMLIRRNSICWINSRNQKTLKELNLHFRDLLTPTEALLKSYAIDQSEHDVDISEELNFINKAFSQFAEKARTIDSTLVARIEALKSNEIKNIEKIQQRLVRTIKQNQEVKLNKIRKLKENLFPHNSLQERKTNFMEFYLKDGQSMIDFLIENCNPFEKRFLVIES